MANKQYTLGRGRLYFDAFLPNTKTKTGERYFGNTPSFSVTIESENLDHFDSDAGIRVKDDSVLLELNRTGTFTTDNIDVENVALFLLGDASVLTQAAAPGQTDSFTSVKQDRYYQLGESVSNPSGARQVSNVTVTIDPGGAASVGVEGTDYSVDLELGRVYIIEGGGIADDTAIDVSYDIDAADRQQIITAANATIAGALRFIATNPKGELIDYYFPYARLSPNGEYALKGDEWQQMSFNVEVQKLDDNTESIYADGRPFTP